MDQFSPAELAELALLSTATMDTQFQYWISVTFAVVIAGFVAGERLTRRMRYIAATLYVLATFVLISRFLDSAQVTGSFIDALAETGVDALSGPGSFTAGSRFLLFGVGSVAALFFLLSERTDNG
jgi:hypothetical protein